MGANTPRKAQANITYTRRRGKGKRTATTLANYEQSFSYVDPATGESDTVSIKMINRDLRWANKWVPKKGDKIRAKIKVFSWDSAGKNKIFDCGKFCCDDISYSGPTLTCTIGGTSVPERQSFRCTERTKTWKTVTVRQVATKIARRYGMKLKYYGKKISIKTLEQSKKTDCDFLNSLCESYGLGIKVYFGKVIIYDLNRYEAKKCVATLKFNDLQDWSYNTTLTSTYTGARIKYTTESNNKETSLTVGKSGRLLSMSEKVDGKGDAIRKARAKVNGENRSATTMSIKIKANLKICAGCNIRLRGGYKLNGKYFVDKVTHNIDSSGAYTQSLEIHKVQKKIS